MKRTPISTFWLVALASCGALATSACAAGDPAATAKAKPGSSAWTEAPTGKANGSGVRVSYIVPAAMQPGQSARVQLQFSGITADDARADWRSPAGASVSSAQFGTATSLKLPPGQVTTVSLDVTVNADGMAYLVVFTNQGGRGSVTSLPLKVGSGAIVLKREGTMQTGPTGEKVISLPSTPR